MAQLKVKQISDFVSAVEGKINGIVGTANVTAIGDAKSQAISAAVSADVVVKSEAISTAVSADVVVKSQAISAAVSADVVVKSEAISTAVSADVVVKSQAISAAVSADVVVLSSAKKYADDQDVIALSAAKAYSDIQKLRINALLQDSTGALDTFAEIETFISGLSTADVTQLAALSTAVSNDAVHASGISANSEAIANLNLDFSGDFDALGSADTAQSTAISTAVSADVVVLSSAKSYADGLAVNYDSAGSAESAYNNATEEAGRLDAIVLSSAKSYADGLAVNYDGIGSADTAQANANSYTDGRETIIKAYADTAETDAIASAKTYTDTEISDLDTELRAVISGVAGVDKTEQIAIFADGTRFNLTTPLSLDNNDILVFVNGLQIHKASEGVDGFTTADGQAFVVSGLGYALEANDHIVVVGVAA
jgi:hypothetical protein